jgi:hypothetical protein
VIKTGHKTTDAWLAKQAIWHDRDMLKAVLFGVALGVAIGFFWGYGVGSPDLSGITYTGLKG